jgi:ParB family chromosome partitioning protein
VREGSIFFAHIFFVRNEMKLQEWSTDLIDPDPNQPRDSLDPEFIQRLAADIRDRGLLQALIGRLVSGRIALIDGHCRLEALKVAGIAKAPVVVLESQPDANGILLVQLAANCLRSDLKPVEKARAFLRLKEAKKWSNTELAKALNLSKSVVTECLSHLSHPPEVQAMIDDGRLPGSVAYTINRENDPTVREKLVAEAIAGKLTRADAIQRVKRSDKTSGPFRVRLMLADVEFAITAKKKLSLEQLGSVCRKIGQECSAGARQGFDVRTLERMLADKARTSETPANVSLASE